MVHRLFQSCQEPVTFISLDLMIIGKGVHYSQIQSHLSAWSF